MVGQSCHGGRKTWIGLLSRISKGDLVQTTFRFARKHILQMVDGNRTGDWLDDGEFRRAHDRDCDSADHGGHECEPGQSTMGAHRPGHRQNYFGTHGRMAGREFSARAGFISPRLFFTSFARDSPGPHGVWAH